MFVTVVLRYLLVLCALASVVVASLRSCTHDKTIASPVIPADDDNCSLNYNLTTPAPPFPELYALAGPTRPAFIHVKYVWNPLVREDFHAVSRDFMLGLTTSIRYYGDIELPNEGVSKEYQNLELMIFPVPGRRHEVSYSTAKAANQGISLLFRRYGYFEVEATIHMFDYIEDKPDGYMILINEEAPPPPSVLGLERDEPLLPLRDG